MITYTCDVCGAKAASVQHVDRYATQMDLCKIHLTLWVTERLKDFDAFRTADVEHALNRVIMDVVVAGTLSPSTPPPTKEVPEPLPVMVPDPNKGVMILREMIGEFVQRHRGDLKKEAVN